MKTILIFGASSAIAQAYIELIQSKLLERSIESVEIVCVSKNVLSYDIETRTSGQNNDFKIRSFQTDYSSQSLLEISSLLTAELTELQQVLVFNGQLHNKQHMPEKKLDDIEEDYFTQLMISNALVPLQCLKSIFPLIHKTTRCSITALSARVGSITDNQLGGWYSYRASKAALNMLFKTAATELARKAKNSKLILFHPGTTDTELSKPFQRNVAPEKLFTPDFVAQQLFDLTYDVTGLALNGEPSYIDWQGKKIEW